MYDNNGQGRRAGGMGAGRGRGRGVCGGGQRRRDGSCLQSPPAKGTDAERIRRLEEEIRRLRARLDEE